MSTLIIVEHDNQVMSPSTRCVLNAACQLDAKVTALVIGHNCHRVAEEVAVLAGIQSVCLVDAPCYAHPLAENISQFVLSMGTEYTHILMASSTYGKNILPRVAALLDVAQVSEVTCIIDKNTFQHPIYAGNAIETIRVLDAITVLSIRTTSFDPVLQIQPAVVIESLPALQANPQVEFVQHQLSEMVRPRLSQANIVVSGGRGLQSAEQFKLIEQLADALGAAVGASRAAVDAGFVSNDCQVGQTGQVVAPQLYFAIGISGAVQHLAGMKDSKVIVAINKDEDAPIFQVATYGLVGDLFELLPQLITHVTSVSA